MCTDQSCASSDFRPFPSFSQSLFTKFVSSTLPSPTTSTRHRIKAKFKSGTSVTHHIDMSSHQGHSEHSGPGRSGARDAYASRAIGIFFCFVLLSIFFTNGLFQMFFFLHSASALSRVVSSTPAPILHAP